MVNSGFELLSGRRSAQFRYTSIQIVLLMSDKHSRADVISVACWLILASIFLLVAEAFRTDLRVLDGSLTGIITWVVDLVVSPLAPVILLLLVSSVGLLLRKKIFLRLSIVILVLLVAASVLGVVAGIYSLGEGIGLILLGFSICCFGISAKSLEVLMDAEIISGFD